MHKLGVVHGDLKAPNVLVTEEGIAKLCDFGHSRFVDTVPSYTEPTDSSSTFQATTRRLNDPQSGAFFFFFKILSKLRPYHVIASEHRVSVAIIQGRTPSTRPEPPYAAGCLNDSLWAVVKACWSIDYRNRPTAALLLERIKGMIRQGLISTNAATPLRPTTDIASANVEWPESLEDYSGNIWIYRIQGDSAPTFLQTDERRRFDMVKTDDRLKRFVVKVPRLPGGLSTTSPEDDQFRQFLRIAAKERFELDHENLVDLIGLDKSYGRYPGIVLEYCPYGDLTHFHMNGTTNDTPELLVDNPEASPESDMWSFGCVAFWIYTDLHPYPNLKKEYDIVRAIESGTLPNDMDSIRNIEALGSHLKTGADSPWITNGTLSHILRCWDSQAKARPSAKDIIKHLDLLPNTGVVRWRPPSGVPDLTGPFKLRGYQHTDNPVKAQVLNAPPLASHPTRWDAPELFQDVSDSRAPFPTRYTDLWSFGSLIMFIYSCKLPYAQSELPGAIARLVSGEKPYAEDDCAYEIRSLASSLWEDIPYQRSSASKVLEMIEVL
ncbi:protein kinase byr2 [Rhizoctonia solani]|uniref:Protein kinase byr2 n=1 Tax=Rhizoctonia solani TaxID=456999 RepID=A0A8H8P4W0_9AGAM|nr:protein kinase byr2 [Rhizoctonia solani]QRW25205.1 protein kinase byr2 [Rhizoctonia solani]